MSGSSSIAPLSGAAEIDRDVLMVPHPRPYAATLTVNEPHLGRAIPHVDNTQVVRWLDRVAELHADSLGYTRQRMIEDGLMWFVARHEVDYHAEAWLGDELLLLTWVRDMQRIKSWREYIIYRPTDQTIVSRAATLWVLVDLDSRRPRRIPREMAEAFEPLEIRNERSR